MKRSLVLVLLFAACGDNSATPDAQPGGDAPPPDAHVPMPRAVAAAGDFMSPGTGIVSRLDITALDMRQNVVPSAAQGDPVLRQVGDKLYVINRFGSNNVTILDAKTLMFEDQISTGADSNPQDVAAVGGKLYVPALGTKGVVVISGGVVEKTIDLTSLDTMGANDMQPDCVSAYAVGSKLYVACGLLDSFAAVEVGKIAVIDTATDTLETSVAMSYKNPSGFLVATPASSVYAGDLLIATVPDFQDYSIGCVQRVSTGATPMVSCGPTNQQLGGFANRVSVSADGKTLYVAVGTYDASFNETGTLTSLDLGSGMLSTAPLSTTSQLIVDVAACPGGDVVAADKAMNAAGLRVWRGTTERTTEAMSIGLRPVLSGLVCYDP